MKVAIMGAGLSGLACAITLEKNGISPVVFEKRSQVGDRFVNAECFMPMLTKPIENAYAYFAEEHGIYLRPLCNIRKIHFFSENKQSELSGHLGYINLRGRDEESFENQLLKQVDSEIRYNSNHSYEELLQDFTHVVVATGDAAYTVKIQDFKIDFAITIKGATIEGDFDRHHVGVWLNNSIAPKGYAYLVPYSEKEASIALGFPEYRDNETPDVTLLWERFYDRVCQDYDQDFRITDNFEINHFLIGSCPYPRLGNTFFTGNCFGALMPALGFGQFASLLTGIYAAHDLCGQGKYSELVKPLIQSYKNSLAIKRQMEKLDNKAFDTTVSFIGTEIAHKLINSPKLNPFKIAGYLLRPFA